MYAIYKTVHNHYEFGILIFDFFLQPLYWGKGNFV